MSQDYKEFINSCWSDHANNADDVAERLKKNINLIEEADQVPQYVAVINHVFGGHLGKWDDGLKVLEEVEEKFQDESLTRGKATLNYCRNNQEEFEKYLNKLTEANSELRVFAMAATELSVSGQSERALEAFEKALSLAPSDLGKDDPATRNLAISGNNMACDLEEKDKRSEDEVKLMILAAETGRKYWEIAGTWENVERAEYRLSQSHLKAMNFEKALFHANECKRICDENNAPPFEQFFAHEAMVKIHQAICGDYKKQVQEDWRQYCVIP